MQSGSTDGLEGMPALLLCYNNSSWRRCELYAHLTFYEFACGCYSTRSSRRRHDVVAASQFQVRSCLVRYVVGHAHRLYNHTMLRYGVLSAIAVFRGTKTPVLPRTPTDECPFDVLYTQYAYTCSASRQGSQARGRPSRPGYVSSNLRTRCTRHLGLSI